jgi:tetratricopeptide (TPR) repeat protein
LIEEIKNRAKSSIKASNYYDAVKLYQKAIDTSHEKDSKAEEASKKDLAILYANKSMCELAMKQYSNALADAENAISNDPSYLKGYYRKAMTLIEMKNYAQAKEILLQGLAISPTEKDFITQAKRVDELLAQAPAPSSIKPLTTASSSTTTTYTSTSTTSSEKKVATTSSKPKATEATDSSMVMDEEEQLSLARGYRKTADGRVTTFFNHELDDQTKSLIGDIAPKKLDGVQAVNAVAANDSSTTSAWNSAGTYEERIFTPWATDRLKQLMMEGLRCKVDGSRPNLIIAAKDVTSIKGDAQISMIRGKRKHIYDFSMEISLSGSMADETMSMEGSIIKIEDVTADMEHEVETTIKAAMLSADEVKMIKKALEAEVNSILQRFDAEFKTK